MKNIFLILAAAALALVSYPAECQQTTTTISHPEKAFWGTFHAGYSNIGATGTAGLDYCVGHTVFGITYSKSHICYKDDKIRPYFLNDGVTDNHQSVVSWSATCGYRIPGRVNMEIAAGLSWTHYTYLSTDCIEHNLTLPRIWQTIIGCDYTDEIHGIQKFQSIGVPVRLLLHFSPRRGAGFDMQFGADLNMHSVLYSAGMGIRIGRIEKRK